MLFGFGLIIEKHRAILLKKKQIIGYGWVRINEAHNIIDCIADTGEYVDARQTDIAIRNENGKLQTLQRPKFQIK